MMVFEILAVILFILCIALGFLLAKSEKDKALLKQELEHETDGKQDKADAFALLAQKALDSNSERFIQLAQEKLKQAQSDNSHDLDKRQKAISDLVDPIGKTLKEMEGKIESLGKAGAGLHSQLQTFAGTRSKNSSCGVGDW